jgi:RNA polymerase sigma-70 factor (ECF subfamily)
MFTGDVSQAEAGSQGVPTGYAGGANGSRTRKAPRLASTETDEMHWVACMARVRDHADQGAFAALFRHFAPRVKAFLMKSGASEALAEECMQDVMATVWTKAALFDPTRASLATWVFTIARNRRIDAFRRDRRPEPEDLTWGPEAEPDQADVMAFQQEAERLAAAIASLPDKQRDLIERAYFGDLSHSEIAEATGLPLGTIKSRIRLALDRLRHALT